MRNSMENLELSHQLDNETKRRRFDEVSEKEKIERFSAVQSLFADKNGLVARRSKGEDVNEEDINRSNYLDFFENVYKYTDEFKMDNFNKKQVAELFEQALTGNKIIKKSLKFFLESKKMQSNLKNTMQGSLGELNNQIDFDRRQFATSEEKGRQLDVGKLRKMFEWSLNTFINGGGEKIGRKPPKINEEERKALADDLEDILNHVNEYRK